MIAPQLQCRKLSGLFSFLSHSFLFYLSIRISPNGWRVSEVPSESEEFGRRHEVPKPDTRLLSECISTEASDSERRVSRSAIYITLLNSKETEYKNTLIGITFCNIFRAYSNLLSFSLDMIIPLTLYWS